MTYANDSNATLNFILKRQIKTSGLWICPRTGHAINLEEPAAFNREIQNFLSTVERGNWLKRDKVSIKDIKFIWHFTHEWNEKDQEKIVPFYNG